MATPEEEQSEKIRILNDLLDKYGDRTGAVSKAMIAMAKIADSGAKAQESLNRQKIVEKKLVEDASKSIQDLYKQVDAGSKTQREANEEMVAMRNEIRENNNLTIKQKASMLSALDTARAKAQTDLQSQKITEGFSSAMSKASAVLGPLGATVSGVIKSLQGSRGDPLGGAADMMKAEVSGIASAAQGIGGALTAAAPAFSRIPRIGNALQVGATGMGAALSAGGTVLNGLKDIADPAIRAMSEMVDAFRTSSSAGMAFGGGMSELRALAGQAGMDMRDLAEGVSANSEAFARAGVSATQAARMIGNFGRGMTHGVEATQLMALGFTDVKDRVSLAGSAFEQARMTGTSMAEAQQNIANLTVQYGKDLKILQSIVGKDAEKAMEKGRAAAAATAVQSKLDAEQKKSYAGVNAAFERFGPAADRMRIALAQLAQGGIITDAAIRNDPAAMAFLEQSKVLLKSGMAMGDAQAEAGKAMDALQQRVQAEASDPSSSRAIIAQASVQLADSSSELMKSITMISDALILPKTTAADIDATKANLTKLTESTDKMTTEVNKTIQNQQNLSAALQNAATDITVVSSITTVLQTAQQPIQAMIDKFKEFTAALGQGTAAVSQQGAVGAMGGAKGIGETAGRAAAGLAGAAIGQALIPVPVVGALIGGYIADALVGESFKQVGGAIGSAIGGAVSSTPPTLPSIGQPMARGGIISGPTSGYPATLHGREMVIPLPDTAKPEAISQAIGRGTMNGGETSEQMVTLMKNLNENFENMQSIMRSVADHTARTARGVA